LRDNTERPETLEVGSNIIAGTTSNRILECTNQMLRTLGKFDQQTFKKSLTKNAALASLNNSWKNPFGDGKTGKRIVEILNK